jgi:hypothetical protein
MEVTLERGGGVLGAASHERLGPVDTSQVPDGARVEQLIAEVDFFRMSDDFPRPGVMTDPTWRSIRVVEGDGDRTIRWDSNQQPPDGIRQLVDAVAATGEWQRVE